MNLDTSFFIKNLIAGTIDYLKEIFSLDTDINKDEIYEIKLDEKIIYPLGIHKNAENIEAAFNLYNYFTSSKGLEIFSNFGFEPD